MNLLWITCDELRADAAGTPYGNPLARMPAFERMAREGTVFDRAFVQMPKCVPSRCSMLTGRYPHTDGFRTLRGRAEFPPHAEVPVNDMICLQEGDPNLVTHLRARGYRTCLLGKNHVVEWNLHKKWFDATPSWDFDKRRQHDGEPAADTPLWRADYRGRVPADYDLSRHEDVVTAREAEDFLAAHRKQPFFALVDIGKPHPVYEEYPGFPAAALPLDEIPAPPVQPLDRVPTLERRLRTSKNLEMLDDNDRRRIRRAYWSMCEFADAQVGRILDALDRLGLAENTLVILTSDHGDFAGDRNCFEKWDTAFTEEIVRVPLLLRLPGVVPAGARSDALVELIDLLPTSCDVLGLPTLPEAHGRSLLPLLRGETAAHRDAVFATGGVERSALTRIAPFERPGGGYAVKQRVLAEFPESLLRAHMVRTERHKYIHRLAGDCELYDLAADPGETRNLAGDPACAAVESALKDRLIRHLLETLPDRPALASLHA